MQTGQNCIAVENRLPQLWQVRRGFVLMDPVFLQRKSTPRRARGVPRRSLPDPKPCSRPGHRRKSDISSGCITVLMPPDSADLYCRPPRQQHSFAWCGTHHSQPCPLFHGPQCWASSNDRKWNESSILAVWTFYRPKGENSVGCQICLKNWVTLYASIAVDRGPRERIASVIYKLCTTGKFSAQAGDGLRTKPIWCGHTSGELRTQWMPAASGVRSSV
jgi:hypothetical protein